MSCVYMWKRGSEDEIEKDSHKLQAEISQKEYPMINLSLCVWSNWHNLSLSIYIYISSSGTHAIILVTDRWATGKSKYELNDPFLPM